MQKRVCEIWPKAAKNDFYDAYVCVYVRATWVEKQTNAVNKQASSNQT